MIAKNRYVLLYGFLTGMGYRYARSLESAGIKSASVIPVNLDFQALQRDMPFDKAIANPSDSKAIRQLKNARFLINEVIPNCSMVHYLSDSILWKMMDYRLLRVLGKKSIISFGGTDVRLEKIAKAKNPFVSIPSYSDGDKKTRKRIKTIGKYVRYAATDHELAEYVQPYFEKVFTLLQAMDVESIDCIPPAGEIPTPVIIHIPTNRKVKGTAFIEAAVERLRSEGHSLDFRLLDPKFTQEQILGEIAGADIVIDAICTGAYGLFAVEAMSSGKVVVCYIREDLVAKYPPDLPIVSANPDTVYDKLKTLVTNTRMLSELGMKGRAYALRHHSYKAIGSRLKEIYQEIGFDG